MSINVFKHVSTPPVPKKELKPIQFVKFIMTYENLTIGTVGLLPSSFNHVTLISKSDDTRFDVMLAYDNKDITKDGSILNGFLYLGHWNDGVKTENG